jgi:hypothetical protein
MTLLVAFLMRHSLMSRSDAQSLRVFANYFRINQVPVIHSSAQNSASDFSYSQIVYRRP